jgi:hypothetical protein
VSGFLFNTLVFWYLTCISFIKGKRWIEGGNNFKKDALKRGGKYSGKLEGILGFGGGEEVGMGDSVGNVSFIA